MKIRLLAAFALCALSAAYADGETKAVVEREYNKPILEARASYFYPFSSTFRSLTGNGGVTWELESTAPVWKGLNIWSAVDYFSEGGKMKGINRSVHITMVPITLGLKYIYPFLSNWSVYGGLGCKYYLVEVVNRSPATNRTIFRSGPGGVAELGVMFVTPCKHFIVDLFTSGSYKRLSGPSSPKSGSSSYTMNLSGFNIGGGVGYQF